MKHDWIPHPKWSLAYDNWFICKNCGKEHRSRIIPSVLPQDECLGANQILPKRRGNETKVDQEGVYHQAQIVRGGDD